MSWQTCQCSQFSKLDLDAYDADKPLQPIDKESFELIFNINANEKIFFNEFTLEIPNDFDRENYKKIYNFFKDFKGKPY